MSSQGSSVFFDRERASTYDERAASMAPLRENLHYLTRFILTDLPDEARVLCVGVGTGAELFDLAREFPGWRFTAVDPAEAMLDICRQRAEEEGIADRCVFHEGYLESLPPSEPFDVATSILVSQFIMQPEDRSGFFRQIAARLHPGGYLINCDLASDLESVQYKNLLLVWIRMMTRAKFPADEIEKFKAAYGSQVAVLPPPDVERIIASGGFEEPTQFFQSLLIHAWYARKAANR